MSAWKSGATILIGVVVAYVIVEAIYYEPPSPPPPPPPRPYLPPLRTTSNTLDTSTTNYSVVIAAILATITVTIVIVVFVATSLRGRDDEVLRIRIPYEADAPIVTTNIPTPPITTINVQTPITPVTPLEPHTPPPPLPSPIHEELIVDAYDALVREVASLVSSFHIVRTFPDHLITRHYLAHHLHVGYDAMTPRLVFGEEESDARLRDVEDEFLITSDDHVYHAAKREFISRREQPLRTIASILATTNGRFRFEAPHHTTPAPNSAYTLINTNNNNHCIWFASSAAIYDTTTNRYLRNATVIALPSTHTDLLSFLSHQHRFHLASTRIARRAAPSQLHKALQHIMHNQNKAYRDLSADDVLSDILHSYNSIYEEKLQEKDAPVQELLSTNQDMWIHYKKAVEMGQLLPMFDENDVTSVELYEPHTYTIPIPSISDSKSVSCVYPAVILQTQSGNVVLKKRWVMRE